MKGLYEYMRQPMVLGMLLLTIFASPVWSFGRLFYTTIVIIGAIIGITHEEKRLSERFPSYKTYMEKVPHMFIPSFKFEGI